jgi:hypothetical protein
MFGMPTTHRPPARTHVSADRVRYIKLGKGGGWEPECISRGIVRFGTGSADRDRYPLAIGGQWNDLRMTFIKAGDAPGTATRFTNETRQFFTDDGSTLWITFVEQWLYWAFLDPSAPVPHEDGDGTFRNVAGEWRRTDLQGRDLTVQRLAGSLTKSASYRGTSFQLSSDPASYVIGRINGEVSPVVGRAYAAITEIRASALELVRLLQPRDFELLVDLIFTSSGWRRITELGRTQKTLDLAVELPSTGEQAWIQVKSETGKHELAAYAEKLDALPYGRLFYVHHTGRVGPSTDSRVVVIGPEKVAELVVDAGLVGWLIDKVS